MEQQQQQQHQPGLLGNLHQHLLHPALSSIQSTFSKLLNPNTINNTTTFTTFFSSFPHDAAAMETPTQTAMTIVLATSLVLLLLLWTTIKKILFPAVVVRPGEPCEPPVLKPRVPFVGHILGLALESNGYYTRLFQKHRLPICTLPMLNGKMYLINSPGLIAAGMRNRDLSFDPFSLEFAEGLLGIERKYVDMWSAEGWMQSMTDTIHASLTGENLRELKAACYGEVAGILNGLAPRETVRIPDSYEWLSLVIPRAFTAALFGEKNNPFAGRNDDNDKGIRAIWEFDKGVAVLALDRFPGLIVPKAVEARRYLWDLIAPYYEAELWRGEDVSAIIRNRAEKVTREGVPWTVLARTEINIPWAAVTNTVPDLFWLMVHVFSRPSSALERFRAEVAELTTFSVDKDKDGRRTATIDAEQLEKKPYVSAVYWETHRLYNENLGNRRVMRDTVLRDPDADNGGREYRLEKGVNVQWATGAAHRDEGLWGPDADEWRPERWLETSSLEKKKIMAMKARIFPFGGGRNLCPGRAFAISEALGLVAVLAAGFDLEGVRVPDKVTAARMGAAMRRPEWGPEKDASSMGIRRRVGYEDVVWGFKF